MITRLRNRAAWVAAAALVALALVPWTPAQAAPHALIAGSGSSWASNAVNQWIADVHGQGLQVVYSANGSAAGRQDFANKTVDFAVTDLPYQGVDPATGASDTAQGRAYTSVPLTAGGLSLPYHLEVGGQVLRTLRLSGRSIAGVFTGAIRFWDDPQIEADSRGRIALPHLAVVPVVHSEGAATSYRLASFLSTQYPQVWGNLGAASPYFPSVPGAVSESGSDGVINFISGGAGNGSIGYDEYNYALGKGYPVAAVQNRAGNFVSPDSGNVAVALRTAPADGFDTGDLSAVYTNPDPRAYPLSSWSSALIPTGADDSRMTTAKRQTLAEFLDHGLCAGQGRMAQVGYGLLPVNLVEAGFAGLQQLAVADPNVDLTGLDAAHCSGDPAFTPGDPPADALDAAVPNPPACAAPTRGPCGVPADATTLGAPASTTVGYGRSLVVSTRLLDGTTRRVVGGVPFTLWQRPARSTAWSPLARGMSTATGIRAVTIRPRVNSYYQFRYAGDADHAPAVSGVAAVRVRPGVTLHASSHHARRKATVRLWGTGTPALGRRVDSLQRYTDHRWVTLAHVTERTQRDPDGRMRLSFVLLRRFVKRGTYALRVSTPGSVDVLGATSPTITVVVR